MVSSRCDVGMTQDAMTSLVVLSVLDSLQGEMKGQEEN